MISSDMRHSMAVLEVHMDILEHMEEPATQDSIVIQDRMELIMSTILKVAIWMIF